MSDSGGAMSNEPAASFFSQSPGSRLSVLYLKTLALGSPETIRTFGHNVGALYVLAEPANGDRCAEKPDDYNLGVGS